MFFTHNASAATRTWSGASSGNWNVAGNWDTLPIAGDDLVFPASVTTYVTNNDFTAGTVFNSITLSGGGYTLAGNSVSITTNVTDSNTTGTNIISLVIGGTGATVLKSGSGGILTLSGTNTFTGGTTLSAGQLNINNASALGTVAGTFTISGGTIDNTTAATIATLNYPQAWNGDFTFAGTRGLILNGAVTPNASRIITCNVTGVTFIVGGVIGDISGGGAFNLTKAGSGILVLAGNNTYTGTTTISGGNIYIGNNGTTGTLGAGAVINNSALNFNRSNTMTVSNVISGTGDVVQFNVTGTTILSGANTYTGITYIQRGILSVSSINSVSGGVVSSNLGAPTTIVKGTIQLGSGTFTPTLVYTGTGETTDRVVNLAGTTGGVTIDQSGTGLLKFTSNLTATGAGIKTLTLQGSSAGTGEISGVIVNSTSATSVTKAGTGTWTLSGTNTFTGGTTLSAGQLNINNASALGTVAGTFTISGGTVDNTSAGDITTLNYPMNWNGDFTYAGSLRNLNLGTGAVTMNASRQLTVSGNTLTVGGVVNNSAYDLTKAGAGTLALNGATTLTNLTISAGTLTTASAAFNITGNWSNSGTFTAGSGIVTLNGTNQTITGTNTFNNLTAITPGQIIIFPQTTITTISGTFKAEGTNGMTGTPNLRHIFN